MPSIVNYRDLQRAILVALSSPPEQQATIQLIEHAIRQKHFDQLLGCYQTVQNDTSIKPLKENALIIEGMAQLASYFGHPGFNNTAVFSGLFMQTYGRTESGFYSDIHITQHGKLSASDLQQVLTDDQWLALSVYFGLTGSDVLDTQQLSVATPRDLLVDKTGLHRKQVPLALDAALSIAAALVTNNLQIKTKNQPDHNANLLLVRALFALAGWLRLVDYAEQAQMLLTRLATTPVLSPALHLDALLSSLRYQWRSEDFEQLALLLPFVITHDVDDFTETSISHLLNCRDLICLAEQTELTVDASLLTSQAANLAREDALSAEFDKHYQGCVIIKGPEYLARQWLQATCNQYQLERRYYAIPADTEIHATCYQTSGDKTQFTDLDALLTFCHASNA